MEEARSTSTSLDLVLRMRKIRLKWLGHILRTNPDRLIFQAIKAQSHMGFKGNILMDAPPHTHVEELVPLAADRMAWRSMVKNLH